MTSEFTRIARLRTLYERANDARARGIDLGIGDDAAVLVAGAAARKLAWTIDAHVERVHFRRDLVSWKDEGWRSFVAAASDLAAMGADPWCALSSLTLPRDFEDNWLNELTSGIDEASRVAGAPIVGGNLAASDMTTITTTLLGSSSQMVTRAGARDGDGVWIAGDVGLAAAGLLALERKIATQEAEPAIDAWRRPRLRFEESRAMRDVANAAIDVSDGLAQDLLHIAHASGVHVVLDADSILAFTGDPLAKIARALAVDPIDLALDGGEDYALVAVSDRAIDGFTRIGEITAGEGISLRRGVNVRAIAPRGFDHFRR